MNSDNECRAFRTKLGLTMDEFSAQTGIPVSTIKSIEYGRSKMSPRILQLIEKSFPNSFLGSVQLETDAMYKVFYALKPMEKEARDRVLTWVLERLETEPKNGNQSE